MTEPLAAVLMAGGLGTRMRSAVPKHFHPLLGRPMVDWIIAAGRGGRRRPDRRRRLAGDARRFAERRRRSRSRSSRSAPATRSARRARARGYAGDVLILSGDTPMLTRRAAARARRDAPARGRGRDVLSAEPPDPRLYGRVVRGADGTCSRSSRRTDATPEELAIGEINCSIYVFRASALAGARAARAAERAGRALPDRRDRAPRRRRRAGRRPRRADPREADGVNTRVELAAAAAVLRDRINEEHMLAGVTIVDPETTWIEPDVELEPDVTIHPFAICAARPASRPARRSCRTPSPSTRTSGPMRRSARSVTFAPERSSRRVLQGGHLRGDQELDASATNEGASPVVHRRCRDR